MWTNIRGQPIVNEISRLLRRSVPLHVRESHSATIPSSPVATAIILCHAPNFQLTSSEKKLEAIKKATLLHL